MDIVVTAVHYVSLSRLELLNTCSSGWHLSSCLDNGYLSDLIRFISCEIHSI